MFELVFFFFFNDTATTEIYPLSLHDALPISCSLLPDIVERRERDRAIQRAGVEMRPAEPAGHRCGGGRFSGRCRAVDRNHAQRHPSRFPLPPPPSPMRRRSEKNRG